MADNPGPVPALDRRSRQLGRQAQGWARSGTQEPGRAGKRKPQVQPGLSCQSLRGAKAYDGLHVFFGLWIPRHRVLVAPIGYSWLVNSFTG